MTLRPSLVPFRIGTDIAAVTRFTKYAIHAETEWESPNTTEANIFRFMGKVFSPYEQRVFWHSFRSVQDISRRRMSGSVAARHLGSRWAAKEAVIKALGKRSPISMLDIQIRRRQSGEPFAVVLDHRVASTHFIQGAASRDIYSEWLETTKGMVEVPEPEAPSVSGQIVDVSISHERDYAIAMAIASIEPMQGDVGGEAAARDSSL